MPESPSGGLLDRLQAAAAAPGIPHQLQDDIHNAHRLLRDILHIRPVSLIREELQVLAWGQMEATK